MSKMITLICIMLLGNMVFAQKNRTALTPHPLKKNLSDSVLLDEVQRQTIRYFWDFAHPVSGMARERSNITPIHGREVVTTGGTGFGLMALLVGVERKWLPRDEVAAHMIKVLKFLYNAESYHGAFPHWMNGETGKTVRFSRKDDGADLVETAFLMQGLLCVREYFNRDNKVEQEIRNRVNSLWNEVEWSFFTKDNSDSLYWHWSPNNGWAMDFPLQGYNETLITYILAASSKKYPIPDSLYHTCWASGDHFYNGKTFYGYTLPLGFDYGGPLFFAHYSYLGLCPIDLKDQYADYWELNKNQVLINRAYCIDNPKQYKGYGRHSWGLSASDDYNGYMAHSPTNDDGVISPTAALSSFPYTPEYSMEALRYFYEAKGDKLWGEYGIKDAFSESKNWYAQSYLAIDQGPIVVMIENYRSGLLWKLFMNCPEIKSGLKNLGFTSGYISLN